MVHNSKFCSSLALDYTLTKLEYCSSQTWLNVCWRFKFLFVSHGHIVLKGSSWHQERNDEQRVLVVQVCVAVITKKKFSIYKIYRFSTYGHENLKKCKNTKNSRPLTFLDTYWRRRLHVSRLVQLSSLLDKCNRHCHYRPAARFVTSHSQRLQRDHYLDPRGI